MDRLHQHLESSFASYADRFASVATLQPQESVWERHSKFQLFCMVLSIFFWVFSFTAAFAAITIRFVLALARLVLPLLFLLASAVRFHPFL